MSSSEIITGVQCLLCLEYCSDKSGFNKHHDRKHLGQKLSYRTNALYRKTASGDKSNTLTWSMAPVPEFTSATPSAGPGLFERQTKFLSKGKCANPNLKPISFFTFSQQSFQVFMATTPNGAALPSPCSTLDTKQLHSLMRLMNL